jgi:hydrogenase maturation factor HypF (carbamoyltransferase family)
MTVSNEYDFRPKGGRHCSSSLTRPGCRRSRWDETGISSVAFGGGCFLNRVLTETLASILRPRGLAPLRARSVPPNDCCLSLGQAGSVRTRS